MPEKEDPNKPLEKGGDNDCSNGPIKNRGCTDVLCCIFFLAHWVAFLGLMSWSLGVGDPARLVAHRDFKGAYCGHKGNYESWNEVKDGPRYDLTDHKKLVTSMNVHQMMEQAGLAKTLLCNAYTNQLASTGAADDLNAFHPTSGECGALSGVADASAQAAAFTDPSKAVQQLTSGSPSPLEQIGEFFHNSCVRDCDAASTFGENVVPWLPTNDGTYNDGKFRIYRYHPPPDHKMFNVAVKVWNYILQHAENKDGSLKPKPAEDNKVADWVTANANMVVLTPFHFYALPESECAEDPMYCVVYPGLKYVEAANFCVLEMGAKALGAAADAAGDAAKTLAGGAAGEALSEGVGKQIGDIQTAAPAIIIIFFIALIIGFAFMVLLRFAVGIMVWGSIGLVFAMFFGVGGYFYIRSTCDDLLADVTSTFTAVDTATTAAPATSGGNATVTISNATTSTNGTNSTRLLFEDDFQVQPLSVRTLTTETNQVSVQDCAEPNPDTRDFNEKVAYVFFAMAGLYLLFILCMCSRIQLGIAINKVAAKFMYQTKTILLVPVIQMAFCAIYWTFWFLCALYVLSSVDSEGNGYIPIPDPGPFSQKDADGTFFTPGKCTSNYPPGGSFRDEYIAYTIDGTTDKRTQVTDSVCKYESGVLPDETVCYRCTLPRAEIATPQFAFIFFSLLWNNAFIVAVGQCTIAGAVAIWYFTPNKDKGSRASVRPAVYNCFRYHPGSLAFGAFILAVVQMIKWVLRYIQKQAEQQKNYVLAKIAGALACCVQCFERFIKFLNKNAYIQIAILGKNFCRSAWAAFCLILRNAGRIGILAMIGGMVTTIGIVFITLAVSVVGYLIVTAMYDPPKEISSAVMPTFVCVMIGYAVAKLFMMVFALAVDTTLQCFCADEELSKKGSSSDYTPEELKGFLKDPNAKRGCCG